MGNKEKSFKLTEPHLLEESKALYMDYVSISKISRLTTVPRSTLNYHIKMKWKAERELLKAELFATMGESKQVEISEMTNDMFVILKRALHALATNPVPPTMQQATQASSILGILDKITRLDKNEPTDIVGNDDKPLTIEAIKEKMSHDPFAIKEVEFKEVEKIPVKKTKSRKSKKEVRDEK